MTLIYCEKMEVPDILGVIFRYCVKCPTLKNGKIIKYHNVKNLGAIARVSKKWNEQAKKHYLRWLHSGEITFSVYNYENSYLTCTLIQQINEVYEKIKKGTEKHVLTFDSKNELHWVLHRMYHMAKSIGWECDVKHSDPTYPQNLWPDVDLCKCMYHKKCPHKKDLPQIEITMKIAKINC